MEEEEPYKSEYVLEKFVPCSVVRLTMLPSSPASAPNSNLRCAGVVIASCITHEGADGEGVMRYPDVTVVCGPSQYHGRGRIVITNPVLVVEVLSDSTAATDRGEKFHEYQAMPTLTDHLLVSQRAPLVEHYARGEAGHWDYQAVMGIENTLVVPSLSITLALIDIYDQIEFGEANDD